MPTPTKVENLEQRSLFEEYVAMGSARSLAKLKELTTRASHTVDMWSVKFNWVKRAQERDKEMMENAGIESPRENVEAKKLALGLVNKMIRDIGVFDKDGKLVDTTVKAKNVFDLRTLIDVRDEILGVKEKMERTKNQQTNIDKAIFIIKK